MNHNESDEYQKVDDDYFYVYKQQVFLIECISQVEKKICCLGDLEYKYQLKQNPDGSYRYDMVSATASTPLLRSILCENNSEKFPDISRRLVLAAHLSRNINAQQSDRLIRALELEPFPFSREEYIDKSFQKPNNEQSDFPLAIPGLPVLPPTAANEPLHFFNDHVLRETSVKIQHIDFWDYVIAIASSDIINLIKEVKNNFLDVLPDQVRDILKAWGSDNFKKQFHQDPAFRKQVKNLFKPDNILGLTYPETLELQEKLSRKIFNIAYKNTDIDSAVYRSFPREGFFQPPPLDEKSHFKAIGRKIEPFVITFRTIRNYFWEKNANGDFITVNSNAVIETHDGKQIASLGLMTRKYKLNQNNQYELYDAYADTEELHRLVQDTNPKTLSQSMQWVYETTVEQQNLSISQLLDFANGLQQVPDYSHKKFQGVNFAQANLPDGVNYSFADLNGITISVNTNFIAAKFTNVQCNVFNYVTENGTTIPISVNRAARLFLSHYFQIAKKENYYRDYLLNANTQAQKFFEILKYAQENPDSDTAKALKATLNEMINQKALKVTFDQTCVIPFSELTIKAMNDVLQLTSETGGMDYGRGGGLYLHNAIDYRTEEYNHSTGKPTLSEFFDCNEALAKSMFRACINASTSLMPDQSGISHLELIEQQFQFTKRFSRFNLVDNKILLEKTKNGEYFYTVEQDISLECNYRKEKIILGKRKTVFQWNKNENKFTVISSYTDNNLVSALYANYGTERLQETTQQLCAQAATIVSPTTLSRLKGDLSDITSVLESGYNKTFSSEGGEGIPPIYNLRYGDFSSYDFSGCSFIQIDLDNILISKNTKFNHAIFTSCLCEKIRYKYTDGTETIFSIQDLLKIPAIQAQPGVTDADKVFNFIKFNQENNISLDDVFSQFEKVHVAQRSVRPASSVMRVMAAPEVSPDGRPRGDDGIFRAQAPADIDDSQFTPRGDDVPPAQAASAVNNKKGYTTSKPSIVDYDSHLLEKCVAQAEEKGLGPRNVESIIAASKIDPCDYKHYTGLEGSFSIYKNKNATVVNCERAIQFSSQNMGDSAIDPEKFLELLEKITKDQTEAQAKIDLIQVPIVIREKGRNHYVLLQIYKKDLHTIGARIIDSTGNPVGIPRDRVRKMLEAAVSQHALHDVFDVKSKIPGEIEKVDIVVQDVYTNVQSMFADKKCGLYVAGGMAITTNICLAQGAEFLKSDAAAKHIVQAEHKNVDNINSRNYLVSHVNLSKSQPVKAATQADIFGPGTDSVIPPNDNNLLRQHERGKAESAQEEQRQLSAAAAPPKTFNDFVKKIDQMSSEDAIQLIKIINQTIDEYRIHRHGFLNPRQWGDEGLYDIENTKKRLAFAPPEMQGEIAKQIVKEMMGRAFDKAGNFTLKNVKDRSRVKTLLTEMGKINDLHRYMPAGAESFKTSAAATPTIPRR